MTPFFAAIPKTSSLSSPGAKRRGDLLIELPQEIKTRLPRKRCDELAMTALYRHS